jgi:predicted enzyme related to lactoylglutathione lyase
VAQVQGIGGAFIHSEDPDRLAAWYREILGIHLVGQEDGNGHFRVFYTRDAESGILRANPVFAIQRAKEKLAQSGRGFVINLRVDDLRSYLEELSERGVKSTPIDEDPYGLFAHIQDLDGNQIDLYEERFPEDADSLGSVP